MRSLPASIPLVLALHTLALPADAQPLGSFTWQLQPFCNRVTVNVRQDGAVYTLDGFDDQCGAAQRAPLVGLATPNPDGTIGFGLNIVLPDGHSGSLEARISLSGLSGTWRDAGGHTGPFAFGANTGGTPRPAVTPGSGDITGVAPGTGLTGGGSSGDVTLAVDPTAVQSRVTTACPAGQALRSINQNGTAVCEPITGSAGGDITAVNAGVGLSGGATTGDATLDVVFGGDGVLPVAARADHQHPAGLLSVAVGPGALAGNVGQRNTALGSGALAANATGFQNTAVGQGAGGAVTTGSNNTALGQLALAAATTGSTNTALGSSAAASIITGANNTAVGSRALIRNEAGNRNVAVGTDALFFGLGGDNVAVGVLALQNAAAGNANTAVGLFGMRDVTSGSNNTALGNNAGRGVITGTRNTLLGDNTRAGSGALTNATAIGANAQASQDNSLVLGSITGINGATADVNVGIGTATPGARLAIADQSGATQLQIIGAGVVPEIVGRRSQGTLAAPSPATSGAALLELSGQGFDSVGFIQGARIRLAASENWSGTNQGGQIQFNTNANAGGGSGTRMVIDHDGEVGIGTTTPLDLLDVNGNLRVGTGTTGCVRDRDATVIAGTCSSDLRFKRDVVSFAPALDRVAALRPVRFHWRAAEFPAQAFGDRESYGLIAQEVEAVLPELVTTDAEGYKAVNYSKLPLLAVQAIKELKELNDALERRLAALEALIRSTRGAPSGLADQNQPRPQ